MQKTVGDFQRLQKVIKEAAFEVHRTLGGPGLLESVYETALSHELTIAGLHVQRQIPIPVFYKGKQIREPFYLDLLVEDEIIIEVKASERDYPFFPIQLLTHLRLMKKRWGLLINFGKTYLQEGIASLENTHL